MKTEILEAAAGIKRAAEIIKSGGLAAFPTETVYGLGADAFNESAVKQIFEAKGRPQDNPLIVHIADIEQAESIARDIPDAYYRLAEKFMPGALTVVLKKRNEIPYVVTAGGETVAVRMPANDFARELIRQSAPLAAPSANRSKHISPTTAQHVYDDLNGRIPVILDGGACLVGIESTVLDLTSEYPTILRPGAVTAEMLKEVLGEVMQNGKVIKIAKSPGMKYSHYSPVCETAVAADCLTAAECAMKAAAEGCRVGILASDKDIIRIKESADVSASVPMRGLCENGNGLSECENNSTKGVVNFYSLGTDEAEYMRKIYSALREAEKTCDYIIVLELVGSEAAESVMNRVNKAAGGKRI